MSDNLFKNITISYTLKSPRDPSVHISCEIEDVGDINGAIDNVAHHATRLGLTVSTFIVEVEYE